MRAQDLSCLSVGVLDTKSPVQRKGSRVSLPRTRPSARTVSDGELWPRSTNTEQRWEVGRALVSLYKHDLLRCEVQFELELRHDPKVASTDASESPEQLGIAGIARMLHDSVWDNYCCFHHVVRGEAEVTGKVPDRKSVV